MTDQPVILETDISPEHGVQLAASGRLGRRKPFARIKPNADVIQATGGHHVLTHPYIFIPTLAGMLFFFFVTFRQNAQYSITDWRIVGLLIFGIIFVIQYVYVVFNYSVVTENDMRIHFLTWWGRTGHDSVPLVNISNWHFDQHLLQHPFKAGNLAPGVFGVREKRILRNIRFAKEVEDVCRELAKRKKEKMERIERVEVGELRANNVLVVLWLESQGVEKNRIIDRLVANNYPRDRAEQLFADAKRLTDTGSIQI